MSIMDSAKNMMGDMDMDKMRERMEMLRGKIDRNEANESERSEYSELRSKLHM